MRGIDACRGHPLLLAGASAGEASVHAARMHYCWQVLPACINFGRRHRFRIMAGRCCLHALLLAGAAVFEALSCMHYCWQVLPAFIVAGAAVFEASTHAICIQ